MYVLSLPLCVYVSVSVLYHYSYIHVIQFCSCYHYSDRVRMTVFPDDGEEVPSTQILQDRQTNLQKMAQSSQVLRAAVQNLVNYQVRL